jgi:hypothetical protein
MYCQGAQLCRCISSEGMDCLLSRCPTVKECSNQTFWLLRSYGDSIGAWPRCVQREESCEPLCANQCCGHHGGGREQSRCRAVSVCLMVAIITLPWTSLRAMLTDDSGRAKRADHKAALQLCFLRTFHDVLSYVSAWGAFSHSLVARVDFCQYTGCYTKLPLARMSSVVHGRRAGHASRWPRTRAKRVSGRFCYLAILLSRSMAVHHLVHIGLPRVDAHLIAS